MARHCTNINWLPPYLEHPTLECQMSWQFWSVQKIWGRDLPICKSYKIKKNQKNLKLTAAHQYWGAPQCNGDQVLPASPVYRYGRQGEGGDVDGGALGRGAHPSISTSIHHTFFPISKKFCVNKNVSQFFLEFLSSLQQFSWTGKSSPVFTNITTRKVILYFELVFSSTFCWVYFYQSY